MSKVSIVKVQDDIYSAVASAVDRGFISRGDRVLLKPNLVEPADPESGQITTPKLLEAVAHYCLDSGASKVIIGEGPGYYQPNSHLRECFTHTGVAEVAKKLGIEWALFDEHNYRTFDSIPDCIPREFRVTEFAFSCDKFINLPVLKSHWLTKVTLAMKNLKGCLKREDKPLFHSLNINRAIVELCKIVRPSLNIIDGTPKSITRQLWTGYSHWKGTNAGLILVSSDIVAIDVVGSALMGIDPKSVATINLGAASGLGEGNLVRIDIAGEELKQLEFKPTLPQEELEDTFPRLVITGFEKACSGCLIPLLSAISTLKERGVKSQKPLTVYIGMKPNEPNQDIFLAIGDCAVSKDDSETTSVRGCPPSREEILSLLASFLSD